MVSDRTTIPVLKPGENLREPDKAQVEADAAALKLYQDVMPAVVELIVVTDNSKGTARDATPIRDTARTGSGFFIDGAGSIATATHVIIDAKEIYAVSHDGKTHRAQIERMSQTADVTQLKLENFDVKNQPYLKLSEQTDFAQRQKVFAFGYPKGFHPAYLSPGEFKTDVKVYDLVDKNSVANKFKSASKEEKQLWLQKLSRSLTQAEIHLETGNSGGPLVDDTGKVVGISDIISDEDHSKSFFVKVEELRNLMKEPPLRHLDPANTSKVFDWRKFR